MKNMIKAAKTLYKVLSILQVVYSIGIAIAVLALLTAIITAKKIVELFNNSSIELTFTTGVLKLWIEDPVITAGDFQKLFIIAIIFILIISPFILFTIRLFKNIFGEMREGRPFSQNISSTIRLLAYIIFVYAVITPVIPIIQSYIFFNVFDIQQILLTASSVKMVERGFNYGIDFLAVFVGFVVLLLSWVFEYGTKLQTESDETL